MNETPKIERNPETHKAHRREVFWQITFPLAVGLLLALTLAVLAVLAATGSGPVKQAGDAALIFLIIPLMCTAVLFLAIFAGLAFGIIKLNGALPGYARQAQEAFGRLRQMVQQGSEKAVEPFLKIRSFLASLEALKRK